MAAGAASTFTENDLKGRYATALYELAEEGRVLNEIVNEVGSLLKIINESELLRAVLKNPSYDTAQSREIIVGTLKQAGFGQLLQNFVGVIANNRRLANLQAILMAFFALVNLRRGLAVAEVITAHPLTDIQRAQLKDRLAQAGYEKVNLQERIDTKLLGGFVIRIGAQLYDASLKSRLNRLHNVMKGAA
ncbi:ATP synthase F1 subunit delta [Commensalibacter oyaizuii]|uniref:ATP synthase subunit delta n=1 Tax=Commensalibacter oyaizuii TaxID=3043873 RepID=A0ABT6Q1K2_9PROT|nr:ATP synthase F1 subunit delta [Commensalibacter sp. TBRC 16381]MDI2090988.1 ATP synthase F1 subunit delta [Commensalibacter sp. TBRC 16381]